MNLDTRIFDDRQCALGEGALWHSARAALIWFDILGRRMFLRAEGAERQEWLFDDHVSAAGIVDRDRLVIASSRALSLFDLRDGSSRVLTALEADNPVTRSNDGRADPQGGFWIGTMGLSAEPGAGTIWRFHRGELRALFRDITITNAICFAPDGRWAHFADTARSLVWRVALDGDGWPLGNPQPWLDLSREGLNPDGAVIDAEGGFWCAQWGASRVARYDREGRFDRAIDLPARHVSCPAFGGGDLTTLFATSALEGLDDPQSTDGCVMQAPAGVAGQPENRVLIG